jgi:hypothetical protein
MISTVAQVDTRVLALLDDPLAATFTQQIREQGFGEAWDAMRAAMVQYQVPFITEIVTSALAPMSPVMYPGDAGIVGFGELVELEERRYGSTEHFRCVWEVDELPQRDPGEILGEFVWRQDAFHFVGATTQREVRITYWDTGQAPTSGATGVDGALTFLSKYEAAIIGPRKGYDELGAKYMREAVGVRYEEGIIGGALFRLIQPMVRSRQRVQVAPMPYSVMGRRSARRGLPYIAANSPTGGADMPAIFKTLDGTLTGSADGTNPFFFLSYPVRRVIVTLNGITLMQDMHFFHTTNRITFIPPYIPNIGADVMVQGWL